MIIGAVAGRNRPDEIREYCAQDVRATQAIYRRIVPLFTNTPF